MGNRVEVGVITVRAPQACRMKKGMSKQIGLNRVLENIIL